MALDFPNAPTSGQNFTGPNGVVWQWDGTKWVSGAGTTVYAPLASPGFTGNPTAPNPAAGDADTSVATTSFVAAAVGTALHDIGRNLIHNPLFNVAQRGLGTWTASQYTADRWMVNLSGATSTTLLSPLGDADRAAIGDEAGVSALQVAVTGTAGTNDYVQVAHRIEGARRLSGKTVTLSFWARASSGTPKIGYELYQSFGGGGSPSADVSGIGSGATPALSTAWTRYTATIAVPSTGGKTFGTNNNDWMGVHFWLTAGASLNARAGGIGVQSGTFLFWGVQLEIGSQATPLEKPDPRFDLSNCQRFYSRGVIYNIGYASVSGAAFSQLINLPVTMRAVPTCVPTYTAQVNCGTSALQVIGGQTVIAITYSVGASVNFDFEGTLTASADL